MSVGEDELDNCLSKGAAKSSITDFFFNCLVDIGVVSVSIWGIILKLLC